ncbi:MAG: ABC transporter permease [Longimicrobiales bacterium]
MISKLHARLRSLWRGIRQRPSFEAEMSDEFRAHIEMRATDLARTGRSQSEALKQARREFGSTERYKEEARASRGLHRVDALRFSWLDLKLGARMLVKYPGLSLISGLTLAAAIAIGASWHEVVTMRLFPELPFADGERIVRIEHWDAARLATEPRSVHDYLHWRDQLTAIVELGAYRALERNLISADGRAEPVRAVEISASAFPLTRVPPLLGRPLLASDQQAGAAQVVVIGHDVWQRRFLGDDRIIGRTVQLGRTMATVVGVMPEGFGFPHSQQLWLPLQLTESPPREGPPIEVFGRLAAGATLESAQAELNAIGQRMAASNPATHEHLRPRVGPYAGPMPWERFSGPMLLGYGAILLVLLAACANVATLVFARTSLRESEIIVRSALGATRGRVIGQLFAEALVLASVAALVGLALASFAIRSTVYFDAHHTDVPPAFWLNDTLELPTVLFAAVLAIVCAVLVGMIPALKATGTHVQEGLKRLGSGGTSMRFGGIWSVIIIGQVAFTVLCLPPAIGLLSEALSDHRARASFPAPDYFTFRPELDREAAFGSAVELSDAEFRSRLATAYRELKRRLLEQPGVTDVTFASHLPGMVHPRRVIEVQRGSASPVTLNANLEGTVPIAAVDVGFFRAFHVPLVAGRNFLAGDVGAQNSVVIVNESFARNLGGNVLGVRVRYAARRNDEQPGIWYEIVGVVRNLGMEPTNRGDADFLFQPAAPADAYPPMVAVRVNGDPAALAPRLSAIALQVEPGLRLYDLRTLDDAVRRRTLPLVLMTLAATVVVAVAIFLSAAGLFALMSVSVTRRAREMAIRLALGASRRGVLSAMFARAAFQLGTGILVGNLLVLLLFSGLTEWDLAGLMLALAAISGFMVLVGLLACAVPARRTLAIQPTEALKEG